MKVVKLISKLLFGKELAMALTILRLIAAHFGRTEPGELGRFVYRQMPRAWKAPAGPATEEEFMHVIRTGIDFYRAVRRVVTD